MITQSSVLATVYGDLVRPDGSQAKQASLCCRIGPEAQKIFTRDLQLRGYPLLMQCIVMELGK